MAHPMAVTYKPHEDPQSFGPPAEAPVTLHFIITEEITGSTTTYTATCTDNGHDRKFSELVIIHKDNTWNIGIGDIDTRNVKHEIAAYLERRNFIID